MGVANPNIDLQNTAYVDLQLDTATGVTELEVRVNCDGTCSGAGSSGGSMPRRALGRTGSGAPDRADGRGLRLCLGQGERLSTSPTLAGLLGGM